MSEAQALGQVLVVRTIRYDLNQSFFSSFPKQRPSSPVKRRMWHAVVGVSWLVDGPLCKDSTADGAQRSSVDNATLPAY